MCLSHHPHCHNPLCKRHVGVCTDTASVAPCVQWHRVSTRDAWLLQGAGSDRTGIIRGQDAGKPPLPDAFSKPPHAKYARILDVLVSMMPACMAELRVIQDLHASGRSMPKPSVPAAADPGAEAQEQQCESIPGILNDIDSVDRRVASIHSSNRKLCASCCQSTPPPASRHHHISMPVHSLCREPRAAAPRQTVSLASWGLQLPG